MNGKAVMALLAVAGVGAAAYFMLKKRKSQPQEKSSASETPPRPRKSLLATAGSAIRAFATAPAPAAAVDDYHRRYTAWLTTLDPGLRSQAPPILPNYLLQGKSPEQLNGYMTDHAARVKAWWGEVSKPGASQAAITTAPTVAATANDAFANLDRIVEADLKRQQQVPSSAAATANQAVIVQRAAETLQRWYDAIPPFIRQQAPRPLQYATYASTAYTQVRADYARARAWLAQLQPAWNYQVAPVPQLPTGMPG